MFERRSPARPPSNATDTGMFPEMTKVEGLEHTIEPRLAATGEATAA